MTESNLTALSLVCSLKPSSSELIAEQLQAELQ